MITLAFDSTAKTASVAVTDGDKLLALYNIDNGLTQSELLLPMAESILKVLKLNFSDVRLLCASMGPGSFTGVRIGAAVVKGLAFGKNIPCVSVSTLEALAENLAGLKGIIVPVMDARRSQVYTAIFESDGENLTRITPDAAISLSELAKLLKEYEECDIYLTGDGYCIAKEYLKDKLAGLCNTPNLISVQNAYSIAKVAHRKYTLGEYVSDRDISPIYLRVPQAERERLERENKNG